MGFFWTIWLNQKSKDIFDAKMAYGQQHFLVWFFIPATPSYTSFSDFSPSVTRSFIRKKLFFENFMLWYLCCRIWNYGDYGPLGYDLSCCGSHCSVSSTFIRIHLILLCVSTYRTRTMANRSRFITAPLKKHANFSFLFHFWA